MQRERRTAGRRGWLGMAVALLAGVLAPVLAASPAEAMPAGFAADLVADGLTEPTSVTFLPDGRMLVTEKNGTVQLIDPSAGIPAPRSTYLTISGIETYGERGVQNLVLDPAFATNGFVYVFYTRTGGFNRIVRYTHRQASGGLTSTADPASATLIWENPSAHENCCHMGGGVAFGSDGQLYITTGDDFEAAHAQDLTHGGGKIHRVAPDGSIPAGNPFADGAGPNIDTIWAIGLRNPFRAQWDPISDRLLIGNVGGNVDNSSWEDVLVGRAGANYGWPDCGDLNRDAQGKCIDPAFDDPLFSYPHAGSGASITGGFRYTGSAFPAAYQGAYFYGDYARNTIRYLTLDGNGSVQSDNAFLSMTEFAAKNPVDVKLGPDGALYIVQISAVGRIWRISYDADNSPPTITSATATPAAGSAPLNVQLTATASDADGDPLTFAWDFGDGSAGTGASVAHTYAANGQYTAVVTVGDGTTSVTASVAVDVGTPPTVSITSPPNGATFRAGDSLSFVAAGSDDGPLGASSYSWVVRFRHNDHTHPALGPVTGTTLAYEIPTAGHSYNSDTAYEVTVTVTDEDGLTAVDTITVFPEKVDITFATQPPGLSLRLDGVPITTGEPYDTLVGFQHEVQALTQCVGATEYQLASWSDGGAPTHTYTVPATDATLTATFEAIGTCDPLPSGLVVQLEADSGVSASGSSVTAWADGSGQGNDLAASGGPTVGTSPSGAPAVVFDGQDDMLSRVGDLSGLPTGSSDRTVFVVASYEGSGYGGFTWGKPTSNQAFGLGVGPPTTGELMVQGWGTANDFASGDPGAGQGWLVQSAVLAGNQLEHFRDGSSIDARLHVFATGSDRMVVGAELDSKPKLAMAVSAVLVFDRALSPGERATVDAYLSDKYLAAGDDTTAPTVPAGQEFVVPADAPVGTVVGTVTATDAVGVTSFAIASGNGLGAFAISSTGVLTVASTEALSAGSPFSLVVEASDAAGNTGSGTVVVTASAPGPLPSGIVLHLEADSGVTTAAGSVTAWSDQSAYGNGLVATGGPTLGQAPSGGPAIFFDGSDDMLQRIGGISGLPTGSADRSVFVVASYVDSGYGGFAWGKPKSNQAFGLIVGPPSTGDLMVQGWGTANDFASGQPGAGQGWLVQSAVVAGNQLRHYRDGSLVDSRSHAFATGSDRMVLGAELDASPRLDMAVSAVLVFDRALSAAERAAVDAYLADKYLGAGPDEDTTAPVITPGQTFTVRDGAAVGTPIGTVQASDASGVTGFAISDGNADGAFEISAEGTLSVASSTALEPGSRTLTLSASDAAGNTGTGTVSVVVVVGSVLPSGLVVQLEADSGVSASGSSVTAWADGSGQGNDLAASGGPTVGTSPSGAPAVVFDGQDDMLSRVGDLSGLPTGSSDRTVFVVASYEGSGYGGFTWGKPTSNQAFGLGVGPPTTGELMVQGWGTANDFASGDPGAGQGWLVQSAVLAGNQLEHFRDGSSIDARLHVFATGSDRMVVGAELDSKPKLAMAVSAVLVFDRALSPGERATVDAYLSDKYLAE